MSGVHLCSLFCRLFPVALQIAPGVRDTAFFCFGDRVRWCGRGAVLAEIMILNEECKPSTRLADGLLPDSVPVETTQPKAGREGEAEGGREGERKRERHREAERTGHSEEAGSTGQH